MPNRLSRYRGGVTRGKRRATEWIASADQGFIGVATGASVLTQSFTPTEQETIVRTRGWLYIRPTILTATSDMSGAFGLGIVSNQALAAGAASIPAPWTDASWDGWLVWIPFSFRVDIGAGQATGPTRSNVGQGHTIDSKAMRKVELNESVVVMCESQVGGFSVDAKFRMLFKLA